MVGGRKRTKTEGRVLHVHQMMHCGEIYKCKNMYRNRGC